MSTVTNETIIHDKRLGKAPARSHPNLLQLSNYLKVVAPPEVYNFWKGRKPFPIRGYGNNDNGDCTRASQVKLAERMERIEQRRTLDIATEEILRVYYAMTERLYGGGDTGAYEIDALSEWRNPERTFRDNKGRPYTIDAYVRINQANIDEVKRSLVLSGAQGIKVCFSLPIAWKDADVWDIGDNEQPIGDLLPGSWGGHSCAAIAKYDKQWLTICNTWNQSDNKISWRAFSIYCDESYLCIDSLNAWKKKKAVSKNLDLPAIKADVNQVSSIQIA